QMVRAVENASTTAEYKYDAMGRRIEKTVGSDTTKYFYSGNQVIEERDANDAVLKQFIYGNGIDELLMTAVYEEGVATPYYMHTNRIGSVTAVTDENGNVVERISYEAFGKHTITDFKTDPENPGIVDNSVIGNEILFQGRRYDKETNLYYYRARSYDPVMGRFLQNDPLGYVDSMNMYQAFNQNPVNFVDPMGEEANNREADPGDEMAKYAVKAVIRSNAKMYLGYRAFAYIANIPVVGKPMAAGLGAGMLTRAYGGAVAERIRSQCSVFD
ncbi:MAG: hypothetical protein GY765_05540, partial [bacterium]|nr:hypothetical protein [bacterium]